MPLIELVGETEQNSHIDNLWFKMETIIML